MRTLIILLAGFTVIFSCFVAPSRAATPTTTPSQTTIAVFQLEGPITEAPSEELQLFGPKPSSLRELLKRMSDAAADDNVKAVVILSDNVEAGLGQIEEIRQAMKTLRDKGKDVYVHADHVGMRDYILYAGASRLSVAPTGDLWIRGIQFQGVYLRGLLDKIGVQPDYMHVGDYKSAGEMFMRTGPSPEADKMMNWIADGYFNTIVELLAKGRNVSSEKAHAWIDNGPYTAEQAKDAGIIDAVEHRQDFDAMLKKKYGDALAYDRRYGQDKQPQLDFSNPFAMFKIMGEMFGGKGKQEPTGPAVGIVYVTGLIIPGKNHPSPFGGSGFATSSDIREALDEAARDDQIKAVVLRVDSPGGSAVASEIILDATRRVKAKKPLVVSMGDIAGSGGYYVTCAADTVFADQSTLTASIGVVGGKLVTTDMWHKLGITFKSYPRGEHAGMLTGDAPFTDSEREHLQKWMDTVYDTFKSHVSDARKGKLKKPLDEMAGGRVYTGQQALDLGLVDKIGTLSDATRFAAEKAGLPKDFDVRVVPKPKNLIEKLMEEQAGSDNDSRWITLALPYLQHLDPQHVSAIRAALAQLAVLEREQVMMVLPEVFVLQ